MTWSDASSPLRLELRPSRLRYTAVGLLAVLAALALWRSALPALPGALVFAAALAWSLIELRRPQPLRLRWHGETGLRLDWPDGGEEVVELRGARVLGPWTLLRLHGATRPLQLALWPDTLDEAERRALRRRLIGAGSV